MRRLLLFILLSSLITAIFADVKTENVELVRINSVLNAVYPLIDAAQKATLKNQRLIFHYDWLRHDIQAIQLGIAQKINQAPIQPRVIEPLRTHYVKLVDKEVHHK